MDFSYDSDQLSFGGIVNLLKILLIISIFWLSLEFLVRWIAEKGLTSDFYGSIPEVKVQNLQKQIGIKTTRGDGWIHLGWIADIKNEYYRIEIENGEGWLFLANAKFGSYLYKGLGGKFRVTKINHKTHESQLLGEVEESTTKESYKVFKPIILSEWKPLFRPVINGDYVNDHTIYRNIWGAWELLGITSTGQGDYDKEKFFTSASSKDMPPSSIMTEGRKVADLGKLAWAPHVIFENDLYHLFWSPNQLHHMISSDGVHWSNHELVIHKPKHKFFRDGFIYKISDNQFLLYATSKGIFFSRIDLYQSFDLRHWQYIRPAIKAVWGSERNFVTGSMESPKLIRYRDSFYLSLTYNNGSSFLSAVLLRIHVFLNKKSYNDTLIFHSINPYDFGTYGGKWKTRKMIARLTTHAPNFLEVDDKWYITTCGWPFAASLTSGEVAIASMDWELLR